MTEETFSALWENLVRRSHRRGGVPLSEHERYFYAVNMLRGSVPRSGFIGYFENSSVATISDAHDGLRALNLPRPLVLLQEAQAIVLPNGALPKDGSVSVISSTLSETEYEAELDRIDASLGPIEAQFYEQDDTIWNALMDYAERHELKPK